MGIGRDRSASARSVWVEHEGSRAYSRADNCDDVDHRGDGDNNDSRRDGRVANHRSNYHGSTGDNDYDNIGTRNDDDDRCAY